MIEKIDISNFGSYKNFNWTKDLRDEANNQIKFKKLNILYGKNYSGKTTLSKIIRSLETGLLPDRYESPAFNVSTTLGEFNQASISNSNLNIRVYNTDFIEDNLGFLKKSDGTISPFAIIGEKNNQLKNEIEELNKKLIDTEENQGLNNQLISKESDAIEKTKAASKASDELEEKLRNKATKAPTGIKHNPIFKDPNYTIVKIKADIATAKSNDYSTLSEVDRQNLEVLVNEKPMPEAPLLGRSNLKFEAIRTRAKELLSKKIEPSNAIQELLNDTLLQQWVKQGIDLHKEKRSKCGFCGSPLPEDIWDKLGKHFNKESKELEVEIAALIDKIKQEEVTAENLFQIKRESIYASLQIELDALTDQATNELDAYISNLGTIKKHLQIRLNDIFKTRQIEELTNPIEKIERIEEHINTLINNHNSKSKTLSKEQDTARKKLLLNEISKFATDIDYDLATKNIESIKNEKESADKEKNKIKDEIEEVHRGIAKILTQLNDERKGAEKVNEYLNSYFGHSGLKLKLEENANLKNASFRIFRGEKEAFNLSEGECSLVAFCYFMAKLGDTSSHDKELIIYIDDPISSLDSNHIFYIFSLIESIVARPITNSTGQKEYKYSQLFISTHSLEFLKYLKRMSLPKNENEHFMIIGNTSGSEIRLMPPYLKKYITELNYLFGEIYNCCNNKISGDMHHSFYNFGNNLRKFLEAFLFFKYPFTDNSSSDHETRIRRFFGDKPHFEPLVQRLINEFSHLSEFIDRSVQPIDHAEIEKLARFVLEKIKENDHFQYESFLKSIEKPDLLAV